MNLTVAEAITLYPLSLGTVAAGKNGLNRTISRMNIIEFSVYADLPFEGLTMKEDSKELTVCLLSTVALYPEKHVDLIRAASNVGTSALVFCYNESYEGKFLKEALVLADEQNLPIIFLPNTVPYSSIISMVMDRILNYQADRLKYSLQIQNHLTSLLLCGNSLEQFLKNLEEILQKKVYYATPSGELIFPVTHHQNTEEEKELGSLLSKIPTASLSENEVIPLTTVRSEESVKAYPIFISSMYYGTVLVFHDKPLTETQEIALSHAKNALATITLNKIRASHLKDQKYISYLNDILNWNFANDTVAVATGEALDIDIASIRLIMLLQIPISDPSSSQGDAVHKFLKLLLESSLHILIYPNYEEMILFLPEFGGSMEKTYAKAASLASHILLSFRQTMKLEGKIGIGQYYRSPSMLETSFMEARNSLALLSSLIPKETIAFYKDYKLYSYFSTLTESQKRELLLISNSLLAPLAEYDKENHTELYETFRLLLEYQSSTALVSEVMFIHKNTLLQRKKKIISLLQVNPFEEPHYFQFKMAFLLQSLK